MWSRGPQEDEVQLSQSEDTFHLLLASTFTAPFLILDPTFTPGSGLMVLLLDAVPAGERSWKSHIDEMEEQRALAI
jgi:hypothetical protein